MKWILVIPAFIATTAVAQTKKPAPKPKAAAVTTTVTPQYNGVDSVSYALALLVAEFYRNQGLDEVNPVVVKKAFEDVYNNQPLFMTEDQANMTVQHKMQEYMAKKANAVKDKSNVFLEENKKRPEVVTLPSGLQYEILTKGTGPIPTAESVIKAHYAGTMVDGTEIDNSYKRGQPLEIRVGGVISGWTEALQLMPVGSKWKLFIPSNLAYGDMGKGAIPGGAALIFDIELISIVN